MTMYVSFFIGNPLVKTKLSYMLEITGKDRVIVYVRYHTLVKIKGYCDHNIKVIVYIRYHR